MRRLAVAIFAGLILSSGGHAEEKKQEILTVPPQEIYSAYRNYREHLEYLYLLKNVPVSTVPKLLPLKPQVVEVHPSFVSQIILPPSAEIDKAYASLPVKFFKTLKNTVLIQPSKQAAEGNLIIYYFKDGRPETLNLILKVYDPTNSFREPFYPQVVLTEGEIRTPSEVLDRYYSIYGHYPQRPYEIFRWDGVSYLIQRSSVYGTVKAGKYRYLVIPTTLTQ